MHLSRNHTTNAIQIKLLALDRYLFVAAVQLRAVLYQCPHHVLMAHESCPVYGPTVFLVKRIYTGTFL